jgi:lipoprotein-anchoring transpeptidase ErfK/SrfK
MPRAHTLRLAAICAVLATSATAGPIAPTSYDDQNTTIITTQVASPTRSSAEMAGPEDAEYAAPANTKPRRNVGGGSFMQVLYDRPDPRYYTPPPPPPRYQYAPPTQYRYFAPPRPVVIRPDPRVPYDHYYIPPRIERPTYVPRAAYPSPAQKQPAAEFRKTVVPYDGPYKPGTIVIETSSRHLYLVQDDGTAIRYGVGVGRDGFGWTGTHKVSAKREWPTWTPPAEMRARQPYLPVRMEGGPNNPLGARAMYLGSTLYRIHGSNEPQTIGHAVSSGCFRMTNDDVIDLYEKVKVGTEVVVL